MKKKTTESREALSRGSMTQIKTENCKCYNIDGHMLNKINQ
jgi:hypothetical protein